MNQPLGRLLDGTPLAFDLDALVGSHLAVVANSGGGKSGLLRKLLETTHGRIQHIVLDVEDEFYTLRQGFDYVIAGGDSGDAPATVENAAGLATAALTHGFSLIVQLNDLGADGAPAFVGRFLTSLMEAPRSLWRPVLVVLDEAQRFAPRLGETEATAGVKDLLARGRKRGFTSVLASQSLPEIDPRIRGLTNNWMLGRAGTALDRKTVAGELGFAPSSEEARGLASLKQAFWGFGPAVSREPVLFNVADVQTPMPKPGQPVVPTPPPPEALRAILSSLPASKPKPDSAARGVVNIPLDAESIKAESDRAGYVRGRDNGERDGRADAYGRARRILQTAMQALEREADTPPPESADPIRRALPEHPKPSREPGKVSGPQQQLLNTLLWTEAMLNADSVEKTVLALLAGVSATSSAYTNNLGAMRTAGLVSYPAAGRIALTPEGRTLAFPTAKAKTNAAVQDAVMARLSGPQREVLGVLIRAYPDQRPKEAVAQEAGASPTSSAFTNNLGRLRSLGLIDYPAPGKVVALRVLFPLPA